MKVFLSHAISLHDASTPNRLRAVAASFGINILLPERNNRKLINSLTKEKIKKSDACVALVTTGAIQIENVNEELQVATSFKIPIVALAESKDLIFGVPSNQVVIFNRKNPALHEEQLMTVLEKLRKTKKAEEEFKTALMSLAGIGLGLLALSSLTEER